jgi:hypothetical protein
MISIDTLKRLFALLLLLQIGLSHAIPPGVHLQVCIGNDIRLDLSPDSCTASESPQTLTHGSSPEDDHHRDCIDFEIRCTQLEAINNSTPYSLSSENSRRADFPVLRPGTCDYAVAPSSPPESLLSSEIGGDISPCLAILRTITLLI